jgi:hypothetical protein
MCGNIMAIEVERVVRRRRSRDRVTMPCVVMFRVSVPLDNSSMNVSMAACSSSYITTRQTINQEAKNRDPRRRLLPPKMTALALYHRRLKPSLSHVPAQTQPCLAPAVPSRPCAPSHNRSCRCRKGSKSDDSPALATPGEWSASGKRSRGVSTWYVRGGQGKGDLSTQRWMRCVW